MEILKDILKSIPEVSSQPLSLVAVLAVIAAWLVVTLQFSRVNKLLGTIRQLPEKQKLKAIELEYRTTPTIDGEQFLRLRKMSYCFAAFAVTVFSAIVILALAWWHNSDRVAPLTTGSTTSGHLIGSSKPVPEAVPGRTLPQKTDGGAKGSALKGNGVAKYAGVYRFPPNTIVGLKRLFEADFAEEPPDEEEKSKLKQLYASFRQFLSGFSLTLDENGEFTLVTSDIRLTGEFDMVKEHLRLQFDASSETKGLEELRSKMPGLFAFDDIGEPLALETQLLKTGINRLYFPVIKAEHDLITDKKTEETSYPPWLYVERIAKLSN